MATKSTLKTIHIKTPMAARNLASALEHAQGKSSRKVTMSRGVSEASREEIQKMFGGQA